MTPVQLFACLQDWRDQGRLRALDLALARFLHDLDPQAPAALWLGAALLSRLEARGHACLPLDVAPDELPALLDWPAGHAAELAATLERAGWPHGLVQGDLASPALQRDPPDESGRSPLVMDGGRLYLRRYWRHERRVATALRRRADMAASARDLDLFAPFDLARARQLLDRLFPPRPQAPGQAPDWQRAACALALRAPVTLVTGGPGTGKTYTAARMLALMQATRPGPAPLRVALAAPTGKAAARLRQSIEAAWQALPPEWIAGAAGPAAALPGPALTLHALLGARPGTRRFRHDADHPLDLDLLFVDEASMVHLEMMSALLDALPAHTRLVLLGDQDQLASVEAGSVLADLCQGANGATGQGPGPQAAEWVRQVGGQVLPPAAADRPGLAEQVVVLRDSRRFAGSIGALARAVNAGDAQQALRVLREPGDGQVAMPRCERPEAVVPLAVLGREGAPGGYRAFAQALALRPADPQAFDDWVREVLCRFDACRVLCAVREGPWGVAGLNAAIERALVSHGLPEPRGPWYEGRPVMVTRNDPALGVFNGDIGIVLPGPGAQAGLRAWFADGAALRSVAVGRLPEVETAFAMTVHKSQGSEFAHVVLVLPEAESPVLSRELLYTGVTRARQALTLACRDPAVPAEALRRRTRRFSGLSARLCAPCPPGTRRS